MCITIKRIIYIIIIITMIIIIITIIIMIDCFLSAKMKLL